MNHQYCLKLKIKQDYLVVNVMDKKDKPVEGVL